MMITGSLTLWIGVVLLLWFLLSLNNDTIPTHDESKRYQELRKRPDEEQPSVVRSFRYRRNAMRWMPQCDRFRGTLVLVDSKTQKILYSREID